MYKRKNKLFRFKRCWMSLVEVLIAMTILSGLLVFVFGFFREMTQIDAFARWQQEKAFQLRYAEYRLLSILSSVPNDTSSTTKNKIRFETESPGQVEGGTQKSSLVFHYNNGVKRQPAFSGFVLARLYVDEKKRLCLAIWPIAGSEAEKKLMQKEVLLEDVEDISFEFLTFTKGPSQRLEERQFDWQTDWQRDDDLPLIIRIKLALNTSGNPLEKGSKKSIEEKVVFAFPIPVSGDDKIIYYP